MLPTDLELLWSHKTDDEIVEATRHRNDYTDEKRRLILIEFGRRNPIRQLYTAKTNQIRVAPLKKPSEFFFKLGGTAWAITLGLTGLALVAGWFKHSPSVSTEAWHTLWFLGTCSGLACFIVGWVFSIWEKD